MFMNIHTHPEHLFTVAVTAEPVGTPAEHLYYDEVDVWGSQYEGYEAVLARADLAAYDNSCRIVGVINQSLGEILWQDPDSERTVG